MTFHPGSNDKLPIDGVEYVIAGDPVAPETPYARRGRQSTVYQLVAGHDRRALKVFELRYSVPSLVALTDKLAAFVDLRGLSVCSRTVLTASRQTDLLRHYPDLTYAVLMPWVEGPSWAEVMLEKRLLTPEESLRLARALAEVLAGMEGWGVAHCDLSGPNVLTSDNGRRTTGDNSTQQSATELVDVEQLFGPGLSQPELLPADSPGYAHRSMLQGAWESRADRFAGAVLIAEMLGWCDPRVRDAAWGESYFDPGEVQQAGGRYYTLLEVLRERWGHNVATLFERAWASTTLADCPTFGQWLVTLPEQVPLPEVSRPLPPSGRDSEPTAADNSSIAVVRALMGVARQLASQGNVDGALENLRYAQSMAPAESGLSQEVGLLMQELAARQQASRHADATTIPAVSAGSSPPLVPKPPPPRPYGAGTPVTGETEHGGTRFEAGLAAYRRGDWELARTLMSEVASKSRQPSERQQAVALLAEIEKRVSGTSIVLGRRNSGVWTGVALLAVLLVFGTVAISFMTAPRPNSSPAAEATRTLAPTVMVLGTATVQTLPSPTAVAKATAEPTQVTSKPYAGKKVTIFGVAADEQARLFQREFDSFTERTGITVSYEGDKYFETIITTRVAGNNAPDIAQFYQPGLVADFVRQGKVIDLNTFMDREFLQRQYAQSFLDLATVDGKMAGLWHNADVKSLVWYPKEAFDARGYTVPTTWAEMIALSDRIAANGSTPWCIGIESGTATGWVGTDWIENIMLRTTRVENYDRWTRGELKFNSPEVSNAFRIMNDIWANPRYVYGGTDSILSINFGASPNPMFTNPPGCYLHHQASFITNFFPRDAKVGTDVDYFYLPPIDSAYGKPVLGSGSISAMFNDRPEVREVMKFLATGESMKMEMEAGTSLAPQKDADLNWYPNEASRGYAKILQEATTFRFDGSDLMPAAVGAGSFWKGIVDYVEGKSLNGILNSIDDSWPNR